jgi:hypothetical protein
MVYGYGFGGSVRVPLIYYTEERENGRGKRFGWGERGDKGEPEDDGDGDGLMGWMHGGYGIGYGYGYEGCGDLMKFGWFFGGARGRQDPFIFDVFLASGIFNLGFLT